MQNLITGIHHITAIASEPQKNLDFYTGVLGLRLVKKTVNFDAPDVYHFYYGNEAGTPGTILTFFPFEGIRKGRRGNGMLNVISFSLPLASLDYWRKRLKQYNIESRLMHRFDDETILAFEDHDGLQLEFVFNNNDKREGFTYGHIPIEHSVKGFYGAEIWEEGYEQTAELLTELLNHKLITQKENRFRFAALDAPGNYIDIVCSPDSLEAVGGGGTVHHIAFATADVNKQKEIREKLVEKMLNPTPVIDRQYFKSIYFREPGGVLFEVATAEPGFAVDEEKENLGRALKLPPQYEQNRKYLEGVLTPVNLNLEKYA